MSIKRYRNVCENAPQKTPNYSISTYAGSLHEKMEKPKHYSLECDSDVHCITVMPNRSVHFHNHKNRQEMIHLVTFDMLKNPEMEKSELCTCLKVFRGLRTKQVVSSNRYGIASVSLYANELIATCIDTGAARQSLKEQGNPVPWRQEVLGKYKQTITDALSKEIKYYGMGREGGYNFKMNFSFCLSPSFMPSAMMELKKDREGWGYSARTLTLDIQVSPKWLINVWNKGRAVILQNLVLSIVKDYPNGTCLAMVGKQSHGFKIIPRLAIVDYNRQVISWVNDTNRKDELLDTERMPRLRRTKKELMIQQLQPLLDVCNKEEKIMAEAIDKQEDIPF